MKVQITYVDSVEASVNQAKEALDSFKKYNWDAELNQGIIPDTLNENDFPYPNTVGSRLHDFSCQNARKYKVKKSCLFNNLHFCKKVIELDQPMVFAEHDAICINSYSGFDFDEFCFLSYEYAFLPPTSLAKHPRLRNFKQKFVNGVHDFPKDYPLKYYKNSLYKNYIMSPGTAAYALTPKGAKKMLEAAERNGLEQSDFIYNTHNIRMQYVYPSPVKYNNSNLNLSHRL